MEAMVELRTIAAMEPGLYNDKFISQSFITLAQEFIALVESKGLALSKSPFSNSFYAHEAGEEITWNSKPEGSYRLADHWDFNARGSVHCRTVDGIIGSAICQFSNGIYETVKKESFRKVYVNGYRTVESYIA